VSRRSWLFWFAALLVVVLVGGRVLAVETAERAWAATFPGGEVLLVARTLARQMQGFVIVFAMIWATGNLFVVYRAIGSVQMPRRLGDLEIVEAVPQRVLFTLTLGTGILGGLLLSLGTADWWRDALLAGTPPIFGVSDDILHHDLGYYVAVLPWQATLQAHAATWTGSATLVAGLLYVAIGSLRVQRGRLRTSDHARAHLAVLLACLALALAWGAALDPAEVVGGLHGTLDQTAVDVRLPGAAFVAAVGVATAIASLIWGWRDVPNIVLGSWSALFLAWVGCYALVPGVVRASRTTDESLLRRSRAALERVAFGLTPIETGPPPAFSSIEAALRGGGLPLWDAKRVALVAGGSPRAAVALSTTPPGWRWLTVPPPPAAPRFAVETDTGLAIARAPVRPGDTLSWFAPGATEFAVVSPDTWPALRAQGVPLRGSLRRAALAWALQGLSLARAETDGRVLLWRRDVVDRLQRLAPFADFGAPTPVLSGGDLWWVSWGYVSSEAFPLARALPWRDEPVRYLRAGLVGAVRAATGETHVWLAPGHDSLTAAWARYFDPLIEPRNRIPDELLRQVPYPAEVFQLAAAQLARANTTDSGPWTPRPRTAFQVAPGGTLWTGIGFEAETRSASRFVALLAGTVEPAGPALRLWHPSPPAGPAEGLPPDLVGASTTSPGELRIWLAGGSITTLQGLFAQAADSVPRGVASVYLTLGPRSGTGPTVPDALRSLLTGQAYAPLDTTLGGRWEQVRALVARADSAMTQGNLERFGQIWKEIRRQLAPALRPR